MCRRSWDRRSTRELERAHTSGGTVPAGNVSGRGKPACHETREPVESPIYTGRAERDSQPVYGEVVVHASRVLEAFQSAGDVLRLRGVVTRTGYNKGHMFFACSTRGISAASWIRWGRTTIASRRLCGAGAGRFLRQVRAGLVRAAERKHIERLVVDNRYQPKIALRRASGSGDRISNRRADRSRHRLKVHASEDSFHCHRHSSPWRDVFRGQQLPGGMVGRPLLGHWAKRYWNGEVDEILLIELHRAGSLPKARMRWMLTGIGEVLRFTEQCRTVSIDGDGQFQTSIERVRKRLRESKAKRILAGAADDPTALGALRAFQEAGSANDCAICRRQCRARSSRGVADGDHAADCVGGVFSGEMRRRADPAGAGYSGPESGAASRVHRTSSNHAGDCGSLLSER
jgi:ribose transport system substrate-binding protein